MINRMMNQIVGWFVRRAFRDYFTYPSDTTALVLLNAQRGFLPDGVEAQAIYGLVDLARARGWPVVHAPFQADPSMRFPTQAYARLAAYAERGADWLVDSVGGDIVLDGSARLSAFSDSALEVALRARGLERLVLAGPLAELRVDSTLRDGVQHDFHMTVVREACPTGPTIRDREVYERTWARYAHAIVGLEQLAKRAKLPVPVEPA